MLRGLRGKSKFLALIFFKIRKFSNCINLNDICILSGVRTPIGSFQGNLSALNAVDLGSVALGAAIEKAGIQEKAVQELVLGNVYPAGCGQSIAYQVAMSAGLSDSIIHSSINKLCGSGMKAIINGCLLISTNTQEVVAVGGTESMSNVPFILQRKQTRIGNLPLKDGIFHDGLIDPTERVDVTAFAESTIKEYKYVREDLDTFALESYAKAARAQEYNVFSNEITPVTIRKKDNTKTVICHDEEIGKLDVETFRTLKPDLGKDGTLTSGNSSSFADGAAMLILASGSYVLENRVKPLARIISYADASLNRKHIVLAIAVAVRKALLKANLQVCDLNLWEISETFPVNAPLNARLLDVEFSRVNTNGGTISLGHPFGMTGARIVIHLAHILCPGMLGCASISHATGGASAVIIEKL